MKKIQGRIYMLSALLLMITTSLMASEQVKDKVDKKATDVSPHWSYEGTDGPKNWGGLSPKFSLCDTGMNQSPIDLKNIIDANLAPIKFNYNMLTPSDIVNNGHSVQVNLWSGGEIRLDNDKFVLKQFHFHTPSENTIKGRAFPLEMHLVHLNKKNEIAVVGIMFEIGENDELLTDIWKDIPLKKGESHKLSAKVLHNMEFETELKDYYRFNGSLTTPPCNEGVRWIVMKGTRHVSKEQLSLFLKALKHTDNRPVQSLNGRIVLE